MERNFIMFDNKNFVTNKVSVVTPVYNGQAYLAEFLDSILAQTYDEIEMILIDDGSVDNTVSIAESYKEKFKKRGFSYHIVKASHTNASGAINHGLSYVTGEYLIWPDSDDYLTPDSIKERVVFLQNHSSYSAVRSLPFYFKESPGKLTEGGEKLGNLKEERLFWGILDTTTFVSCGCYMLSSKNFFEIYPERKIPEYNVGQNFQMLLPYVYKYACPTIEKKMYGVRIHENSHSRIVRSEAEEEKRFADFESLMDDIVKISNITTERELRRIRKWKYRRRARLAGLQNKQLQVLKYSFLVSFWLGLKYLVWNMLLRKILKKEHEEK